MGQTAFSLVWSTLKNEYKNKEIEAVQNLFFRLKGQCKFYDTVNLRYSKLALIHKFFVITVVCGNLEQEVQVSLAIREGYVHN